jgi:hypothetical protein
MTAEQVRDAVQVIVAGDLLVHAAKDRCVTDGHRPFAQAAPGQRCGKCGADQRSGSHRPNLQGKTPRQQNPSARSLVPSVVDSAVDL